MKLGKLLGAGKSFFGWQGSVSYRENKQVYLPKFNPGQNPFGAKAAEAGPKAEPEVVAAVPSAPVPVAEKAAKAFAPRTAGPLSGPGSGPLRATNWAEKLNPFRGAKTVPSAPPVPMPNVQPEFSLDTVKVVHNDLSDAEVEVVPMKSRSAAPVPMEFLGEPVLKSI